MIPPDDIGSQHGGPTRSGRSGTAASLQCLVVQFATENPRWVTPGSAARSVTSEFGRNTIKRILADHGLDAYGGHLVIDGDG